MRGSRKFGVSVTREVIRGCRAHVKDGVRTACRHQLNFAHFWCVLKHSCFHTCSLSLARIQKVLGFKGAMTKEPKPTSLGRPRQVALAIAASVVALCVIGPKLFVSGTVDGIVTEAANVGPHTHFLFGLGDFPAQRVLQFPWVKHIEPVNALSIPTWFIHFSSVLEYWIAMGLVWQFASTTGNERWKGLVWGMLPLHASSVCACTYHVFYNAPILQFLVTAQAGLTLFGNMTSCLVAYRIAASNGWSPLLKQRRCPRPSDDGQITVLVRKNRILL